MANEGWRGEARREVLMEGEGCHGLHWDLWLPKSTSEVCMDFAIYIGLDSLISLVNFWGMTFPSSMIMAGTMPSDLN